MPLVDYGSSDESDSEENNQKSEDEDVSKKDNEDERISSSMSSVQVRESVKDDVSVLENKLFSHLPTPKNTFSIPDNTFKLLSKKQPVKIVLPSLNEINKSVDEKDIKKPKPSSKGSGLFALLPAPKHSQPLVPDSVKNKIKSPTPTLKKPMIPKQVVNPPVRLPSIKSKKSIKERDEEDDEDDEAFQPESFFFTSTDDVEPDPIEPIEIPSLKTSENSASKTSDTSINGFKAGSDLVQNTGSESMQPEGSYPMETSDEVGDLDAEAIEKLCGARARKRKGEVPEEIIDINVNSMVGDAYMWLSKDLTKEREHRSFKKAKNLSSTERRKHQITYLASQAKEKELELRNQWANSRMTRQQTQSKYGF